MDNFNSDFT
jgi:hypothetical protein